MDLSAIIFVVLALAWAVYLIPKALKHHDEMASDRLVEGHSDKVRILSRKGKGGRAEVVEAEVETVQKAVAAPTPAPAPSEDRRPVAPQVTRAAARKAARHRRRVLGVLVLALAVVWGLTWFAYLPIWVPAVPGALVLAWLAIARLSVRRQQARRGTTAPVAVAPSVDVEVSQPAFETTDRTDLLVDQLADEDTTGIAREDIEAVLADDGSLWDPLPMTLPTYVNKARARRTVRTIELTGINSSGHDQADTTLAREAEESAQESAQAAPDTEAVQRRAAGGA